MNVPLLPLGLFDDLHSFDPATMAWTLLSTADDARRPSARYNHGFTSAAGRLYVHGGSGEYGDARGSAQVRADWDPAIARAPEPEPN